jgi:hypothetical protein
MLTPRESFKVGFLRRCANEGLTTQESHERVKQANDLIKDAKIQDFLMKPYNTVWDIVGGVGKEVGTTAKNLAVLAALGIPIAGGYGAGRAAAKITDVGEEDIDAAKKKELIREYKIQAAKVRSRNRTYRRP